MWTQALTHYELLGFILCTASLTIKLPIRRISQIEELGREMLKDNTCSVDQVRSLCGKLVSSEKTLWTCRVYLREMFSVLRKFAWVTPEMAPSIFISLSPPQILEIAYWIKNIKDACMPLSFTCSTIGFNTDASGVGWGGCTGDLKVSGIFTPEEAIQSSTFILGKLWQYFWFHGFHG